MSAVLEFLQSVQSQIICFIAGVTVALLGHLVVDKIKQSRKSANNPISVVGINIDER